MRNQILVYTLLTGEVKEDTSCSDLSVAGVIHRTRYVSDGRSIAVAIKVHFCRAGPGCVVYSAGVSRDGAERKNSGEGRFLVIPELVGCKFAAQ